MVILFNFYDDGEEYNINSATKAIVHQKTSKGNIIETPCTFINYKGKRVVRFEVEDVAMVEFGYLNLLLTVWNGDKVISIQPFNVMVYDDYMGGASSFIELIQELQRLIENMVGDLNNTVKLTDKGVPNGVASLDELGKIPLVQMPQEFQGFLDHINHTVFEHRVHGLGLDEDEQLMYQDNNGDWQYIGFSPTGVGGGATQTVSASISVADSVATVVYSGVPTVVQSKWSTGDNSISYFTLNGSSFTGNTFPISSTGIHTLYYKDSNGLEYVKTFNVTMDMIARPNVTIKVEDGWVTVTIPHNVSTSIKKWAKGAQTVSYFAYNGTVFTGNTFQVAEVGTYTVYIKTITGLEYVYVFEVTQAMLPVISKPEIRVVSTPVSIDSIASYSIRFYVKDSYYKIVKFKNYNSTVYNTLTTPIPIGEESHYNGLGYSIDFSLTSNKNKSFIFGFENEIGLKTELHLYADNNYLFYWIDNGEATLATILKNSHLNTSSNITFPSTINNRIINSIGQPWNGVMAYNEHTKTITIPESVQTLYPIYERAYLLESVTILNPNLMYVPYNNSNSFRYSAKTVTLKASNNSSTNEFYNTYKNSSMYKLAFQAT